MPILVGKREASAARNLLCVREHGHSEVVAAHEQASHPVGKVYGRRPDALRPDEVSEVADRCVAEFQPTGQVRIDLGVRGNGCPITRVFQLYLASGYAPAERTPEWEASLDGQEEFAEPPCPARE